MQCRGLVEIRDVHIYPSKNIHQKYPSKNIHQKYSSKNIHQKYSSKHIHKNTSIEINPPTIFFQIYSTRDIQPKSTYRPGVMECNLICEGWLWQWYRGLFLESPFRCVSISRTYLADYSTMSFFFVCWQIQIQMQKSWVGWSTRTYPGE